ncbi:MAG TPA: methyltransferase domain-containing protein [Conexibacter sp.]|nr:methyltransferase domain-containing protein [Conexibacter sp.]
MLHVGCGPPDHYVLHESFRNPEWHEVRLDIDPGVRPDIVASVSDMSPVPSSSFDAVYSHHNIEHVFAHEVPHVMAEFLRVLRPGGEALISTPDLQGVAEVIARGRLHERLYRSEAGDISALDVVYGLQSDIAGGREYMAHRTGFTLRTLGRALSQAGFVNVQVMRAVDYALWARGARPG